MSTVRDAPLQVVQFIATRRGEADRGPLVCMNAKEAAQRLLNDGELVYVSGPTRQELAELVIDDELPRGAVRVRDVAGLVVTSVVRVRKPEFDREHERSRMFNV